MNLFFSQLKSLIYKNYLKKRYDHFCYYIIFQILYPVIILTVIENTSHVSNNENDNETNNNSTEPLALDTLNFFEGKVNFVIPLESNNNENRENFINNLINNKLFSDNKSLKYEIFDDINSFNKGLSDDESENPSIIFNKGFTDYTIRVQGQGSVDPDLPPVDNAYRQGETSGSVTGQYLYIFSPLQVMVNQAIIQTKTNKTIDIKIGKLGRPLQTPDEDEDDNDSIIMESRIPLITSFLSIIFILPCVNVMNNILNEKEKGQEQGLIVQGVHPSAIWLSLEILYLPFIIFTSFLSLLSQGNDLFKGLGISLSFLLMLFYGLSTCSFMVIMTKIFNKTKTAILVVFLLYFSLFFLNEKIYNLDSQYPILVKLLCLLITPINLTTMLTKMAKDQQFSVSSNYYIHFIILICSMILYHAIIVCVEFFAFKFSNIFKEKNDFTSCHRYDNDIEEDPANSGKPMVEVKDIFKVYKNRSENKLKNLFSHEKVNVLKGVSFNVYNNEIFGILGHNGAGKSTLIKIMTGVLKADHGKVYYDGLELVSNINKIRKNIGVCFQDSIVYDDLTIEDNFKIFSGLKNVDVDVESILSDILLSEKRYSKVKELSGGQKRKLCIGLSLVGNPKFLFLDEPTSSLDPVSRRKIWEILLKIKKDRVIFLCTHYMDEADILADRKMIINNGTIRCSGSSVYLKNHFNMQYLLYIESTAQYKNEINSIVLKHIPEAKYRNDNNPNENDNQIKCYTWTLPMSSSNKYCDLLSELESLKGEKLKQISLDSPYLEHLFVKVTSENFENRNASSKPENNVDANVDTNLEALPKLKDVKKISFIHKTIRFMKYRLYLMLRNRTFLLIYLAIPIIVIGFIFNTLKSSVNNLAKVDFHERDVSSPQMYHGHKWNYDINNSNISKEFTGELIEKMVSLSDGKTKIDITYRTMEEMNAITKNDKSSYYISSFDANLSNNTYVFDIYYNDYMTHSIPVTINTLSNAILSLNNVQESITTRSHPYSFRNHKMAKILDYSISEVTLMTAVQLCISFIVSFFGPMTIRERSQKLLKQLNLSGITYKSYWCATFIITFIFIYLLCIGIVGFCALMGYDAFRKIINIVILFILLILACLSTLLFQFWMSFYFESEGKAYVIYLLFNLISYCYYLGKCYTSDLMNLIDNSDVNQIQSDMFSIFGSTIFPITNIPNVITKMMRIDMLNSFSGNTMTFSTLFQHKDGFLIALIGNLLSITLNIILIIYSCNEMRNDKLHTLTKRSKKDTEKILLKYKEGDEDVYMEYKRVANISDDESIPICSTTTATTTTTTEEESLPMMEKKDENKGKIMQMPIRIINVAKEHACGQNIKSVDELLKKVNSDNPKFGDIHSTDFGVGGLVVTSLRNVSLGINDRECFGLLGPNGSGKTTLLNIISYNHVQSVGNVYYDGRENVDIKEDHFMIGYCPQNDTLWDELTLYEHLVMYIYLRGFSKQDSQKYAQMYMKFCKIEEHKNKYPRELSGGTRRKLCILLALISFTNKIILDEPSSGMDPATRRYVWDLLTNYKNSENSSIVITTHSIEEAEILCDRIGILVNGELHALGSPAHVKMKYGNSYALEIQCADSKVVDKWIKQDIPMLNGEEVVCEIKSNKRIKYTFKIMENHSEIFRVMEKYKSENMVSDYSLSQTSLEDVFLKFANLQENKEM